ncbi:MAG: signal peptidase II [Pseudobutyrivibrio sp.]|nr:signal peptidase II [Pseudobutyrivibrio sp.]
MFYKINRNASMVFATVLIVILGLIDQYTKLLAVKFLKDSSDYILIPGVLQLHYLENTGAAFSLLEGKQLFFAVLTPIFLVVLVVILFKMPQDKKYLLLDYIIIFLIAGAIGNYIDRISNKYVVDFIYFSLINFPVFNVADIYVTCAVFALLIAILFVYKDEDLEEIKNSLRKKYNG